MAYEQRNNTGSLFKNKKKAQENHPDSTGSIMVEGVEYWLDGWTKTTKDGDKWVSLSVKRKDAKSSKPAPDKRPATAKGSGFPVDAGDIADDLPW